MDLQKDDVVVLMAPNHIHLCIPMYAAFYLGVGVAAVDYTLAVSEYNTEHEILYTIAIDIMKLDLE